MGKGLKYAGKMIGTLASTDNKVVVLVTNTQQNSGQDDPIEEADKLKADGKL